VASRSLLLELFEMVRERKRYWLVPAILVLLVIGTLVVLAQGSVLAPFIYTVF